MRHNLFIPGKMEYARGARRPDVDCILCAIVEGSDEVVQLDVHRTRLFVVALNLYPYTPGHLMVFPNRHVTDPRMLNDEEALELHKLENLCLDVLDNLYAPNGFNIGFNIGEAGGASIDHLHLHIIPRYWRETGFIDIIGGAKVMVEDPATMVDQVRKVYEELSVERK